MIQSTRLGCLTPPEYLSCSEAQAVFNNTWGHYTPHKNKSYKGKVRFVLTDHSQYGSQPIIVEYQFEELEGPYIHDALFTAVLDWETENLNVGTLYEVNITFRNYVLYIGKVKEKLKGLN